MKYIYIAIFAIFAVIVTTTIRLGKYEEQVNRYKETQDSLNWVIVEMYKEIDFLDIALGDSYAKKDSLEGVIDELGARESSLQEKLKNVRDSLEEFTASELQVYFDMNYEKSDSIPDVLLDSAQAVNIAVDIEEGRVNKDRIDVLLMERKGLYQIVAEDLVLITQLEEKINKQERIIESQDKLLSISDARHDAQNKQLKKERIKTKVVGGAGIAAVVLILIIL